MRFYVGNNQLLAIELPNYDSFQSSVLSEPCHTGYWYNLFGSARDLKIQTNREDSEHLMLLRSSGEVSPDYRTLSLW